jgi:PAS domain S-box-containing protein
MVLTRLSGQADALLALTAALNAAGTEDDVVRALASHAAALCDAQSAGIGRLGVKGRILEAYYEDGVWHEAEYAPPGGSIIGHVFASGRPYRSDDLAADPYTDHAADARLGLRTQLTVPLVGSEGAVRGVIALYNRQGGPFTDEDEALLGAMAAQATVALERVRARDDLAQIAAALRESESHLHSIIETSPDLICLLDAGGRYRFVNSAYERILGYTPEVLIGEDAADRIHPDDAERVRAQFRHLFEPHPASSPSAEPDIVCRMRRADGAWRDVEAKWRVLEHANGECAGVLVISRDVTERARIEAALRESEARYRTLVASASDIITVLDEDGTVRSISPAVERVLGYTPEEVVGASVFATMHPDDAAALSEHRARGARLQAGVNPSIPVRHRHRDGSWRWLESVSNNLLDDPDLRGIVVTSRDRTEQKRAEEALGILARAGAALSASLDYHETLQAVTRLMVPALTDWCVIYLLDEGGEPRVVALMHPDPTHQRRGSAALSQGTPVARAFTSVTHAVLGSGQPLLIPQVSPAALQALATDPAQLTAMQALGLRSAMLVPLLADGRTLGVMSLVSAESGRRYTADDLALAEELGRRIGLAIDHSRLHQELSDRTEQLEGLVGRLLSAQEEERRRVAYELHDGLAQVLAANHQRLQAYARRHRPRTERGRAELDAVLDLAQRSVRETRRVVAGLRPTALDDFGLVTALRQEADALREEGWQVTLEENLGATRLATPVETALYRIAQEALTNVRKHARSTRVQVSLLRAEGMLRLVVQDWGQGFDPAVHRTPGGPGERVGMASMQERVGILGGRLHVESAPGRGTRLIADVPL